MTRLEKACMDWMSLWRDRKETILEDVRRMQWNEFIDELFEEFHGVNQERIEAEKMDILVAPVCSYAESSDELPF